MKSNRPDKLHDPLDRAEQFVKTIAEYPFNDGDDVGDK
jgi:hypothetical protein